LGLRIFLERLLRSQQIAAGAEGVHSTGKTRQAWADGDAEIRLGIEDAGLSGIDDSIAKLGKAEAHGMGKGTSLEVDSCCMNGRVIGIGEGLETVRDETLGAAVLFVREAIKSLDVFADRPIQLGHGFGIAKRRIKSPAD